VGGSLSIFENSLFGTLNNDNWESISTSGSIGRLLLVVSNQLSFINNEVKIQAANYLSVCNNW
jgi:hypothetical protein